MTKPGTVRVIETDSLRPSEGGAPVFEGCQHGGVGASFFVVRAGPGRGAALHQHPYDEVFVFLEGHARVWVGEEVVEAHGGQVVIVPERTPHRFINSGTDLLVTVNIHPRDRMITQWLGSASGEAAS